MYTSINHNLLAANTARNLNPHYGNLATSTQRLSSGLRINSAADDAAGLAIRELQRADIAAFHQGARNANDAISMIQVADGALGIIDEKLIRMKELAEQAATGTYSSTQRLMIDSEFQAMASEIDRIANATDFNGIHLLDGSLAGTHDGSGLEAKGAMKIHFGSGNDSAEDYYYINIPSATINSFFNLNQDNLDISIIAYNTSGRDAIYSLEKIAGDGPDLLSGGTIGIAFHASLPRVSNSLDNPYCWIEVGSPGVLSHDFSGYSVSYDSNTDTWTIKNGDPLFSNAVINNHANGCAIDLDGNGGGDVYIHFTTKPTHDLDVTFDLFNSWAVTENNSTYSNLGVIAFPDENRMKVFGLDIDGDGNADTIYRLNTTATGSTYNVAIGPSGEKIYKSFTISTQQSAQQMLVDIDNAIIAKDKIRAHLGALQNRLENTVSNLNIQAENLQAAESRISDVDVATEMTNFVRNQILTQSAVAMLGQANSMPQMLMQLIGS